MTAARNTDPIKKITTKNGETRYRFIIDVGNRPDGKRDQRCFTFRTMKEARAERAKIISDRSRGTLVKRTKITLGKAIDDWLDGRRNLRPSAQRSYRDSLELAKVRLGHVKIQDLTKAHLDALVTDLLTNGRRIGNVQRKGLGPRSVNQTLTLLGSVLASAVRDGLIVRNVAKMVERPKQPKREMQTWTKNQAAAFLEAVANDRLSPAWQLSIYGLRRGEVLGLCWSDIDLDAKTLTVRRARVEVTGVGVHEVPPKTERSGRTLPWTTHSQPLCGPSRPGRPASDWRPERSIPRAVLTAQGLTSWSMSSATPIGPNGSQTSSGDCSRPLDCRPSGSTMQGTHAER